MSESHASRAAYERRIRKAVRYIAAHLDEPLTTETLSRVAGLSPFHFHRVFRAHAGVPPARFVRLLRLKRASLSLAVLPDARILDVALEAGFGGPESFWRAFKRTQGQAPSAFAQEPDWAAWSEAFETGTAWSTHESPRRAHFPETRVAALEHRGDPNGLMGTVMTFIAWRRASGRSPPARSMTLGIVYDDPDAVEPDQYRYDVCGSVTRPVPPNPYGVVQKVIPECTCAVVRHLGSTEGLGATLRWLYGVWLPQSGEEPGDFPCFVHYLRRMPTVREDEQVSDIHLPLARR